MDEETSSLQQRVRVWMQAHQGAVRGLLQGLVILTGAFGLWLIGTGPLLDLFLPARSADVSFLPSVTPNPTVGIPSLMDSTQTDRPRPERAVEGTLAVLAAVPGQDALDSSIPPDAPAPLLDSSPFGLAISQEVAALRDDPALRDVDSQVLDLQGAASQEKDSPDEVSSDAPVSDESAPDTAPPDVGALAEAPQDVAPVPAGGETLLLMSSGETGHGAATEGTVDILPGVFTSILPTVVPTPVPLEVPETIKPWVWPVSGVLSQGFSSAHRAIDLEADQGTIVYAADAGTVVYAKWQSTGYGYLVIVDHHNGYLTYYGHLYGFYIDVGHEVARGEQIGELGTTGRSTGPHLHFEIRKDGVQLNPLDLLP